MKNKSWLDLRNKNGTIHKLEELLQTVSTVVNQVPESELAHKPSPVTWSKKEILGHLIDSGINNLQRFTEIQFENKPYKIRKYNQDELVKANNYQNAETKEIVNFLLVINTRIINLLQLQTEETLNYNILTDKEDISDLKFLIQDYVDHFEHHVNQIVK